MVKNNCTRVLQDFSRGPSISLKKNNNPAQQIAGQKLYKT